MMGFILHMEIFGQACLPILYIQIQDAQTSSDGHERS